MKHFALAALTSLIFVVMLAVSDLLGMTEGVVPMVIGLVLSVALVIAAALFADWDDAKKFKRAQQR